jgi:hypothetical protein
MNKIVVKKIDTNSPEYKEDDSMIIDGTPQECWDKFWEVILAMNVFTKHYADFSKPLRRDVVNIIRG